MQASLLLIVVLLQASLQRCTARITTAATPAPPKPLVFFALADWGGEEVAPYTTPGQLAASHAMGNVSATAGSHPSFVLAAGDNFYMEGLPGA